MDIYTRKSRWKIYLAIAGIIIILISMFYTNYLVKQLQEEELKKVELFEYVMTTLNKAQNGELPEDDSGVLLANEINIGNTTIPLILESDAGVLLGRNISGNNSFDEDQELLTARKEKLLANGFEPLEGSGYSRYIYYEESTLIKLLKYLPLVQLLLISTFIAAGYFSFSTARRSEQNQVWAGMAKETAHQLGTPISAIIAWIEHLKLTAEENPEQLEIIGELRNDVTRLELIADRFSKIGSEPVLEKTNIFRELEACKNYMQKRAPKKVQFKFPNPEASPIFVRINPPLFDWVIENLLRNALDAMGGSGMISAFVEEEGDYINIDIIDTGKGIPGNKLKTVFQPGYTTKKRGWGLGLSLAKRIIENYHNGKIFVKNSKLNEGTTFSIKLPKG